MPQPRCPKTRSLEKAKGGRGGGLLLEWSAVKSGGLKMGIGP